MGNSIAVPAGHSAFAGGRQTIRRLLFLAALAVLHGIVVNLVPALITTLGEVFDLNSQQQGGLSSSFLAASVCVLVASGPLARVIGARGMGVLCGTMAAVGAGLVAAATDYSTTLAGVALLALGMAPIPTIYAAVIGEYFASSSQRLFMWTFALMAASATVTTSVLGGLIDWWGDYRPILGGLSLLIGGGLAAVLASSWSALSPQAITGAGVENDTLPVESAGQSAREAPAWIVFRRAALYLLAVMMVCDFLCATTIVTWIGRWFEESYGKARLNSGAALSAQSAGVCLGRVAMGFLPAGRVSDRTLLAACYLIGVGCFFAMIWFRPPFAVSLVLLALTGAMFAAQSPAMSSLAVKEFGSLAPVAIPLVEAVGNLAGIAGPWLLGGMLDSGTDLGTALYLPPAAGFVLAAVAIGWEARSSRRTTQRQNRSLE